MAYKRKTKDIQCRKCGRVTRADVNDHLKNMVCVKFIEGDRCFGRSRLAVK